MPRPVSLLFPCLSQMAPSPLDLRRGHRSRVGRVGRMMLLFGLCAPMAPAQAVEKGLIQINPIGDTTDTFFLGIRAWPQGVSDDGSVVVGSSATEGLTRNRAFRWTAESGTEDLGVLSGTGNSFADGVSGDGSVVVGSSVLSGGGSRAFRWTATTGMQSLGDLNGGTTGSALDVSRDGGVIVGEIADGANGNKDRAFRWTAAGGIESLGVLHEGGAFGSFSSARGVSADGTIIVGNSHNGVTSQDGSSTNLHSEAFTWTRATGMTGLGQLNGGDDSFALAVGVDGDTVTVVGLASDGAASNQNRAVLWRNGVIQSLGTLAGDNRSIAWDVSADGRVIVGESSHSSFSESYLESVTGFRYTDDTGMQTIEDWLRDSGVAVADSLAVASATAVNADGSVVVGVLRSGYGYIARGNSGLITLEETLESLSSAATVQGQMQVSSIGVLMNGAHSRPLSTRLKDGKRRCLWATGDWGKDDHGGRGGQFGLMEVGGCHALDEAQINLALGKAQARDNLDFGGRSETEQDFVFAEVLLPLESVSFLPGTPWITLSGAYAWGDAQLRRGYLNAGLADQSQGSPDLNVLALRARLTGDDMLVWDNISLSPYLQVGYTRATVDAYTEQGGGFPARFDENNVEFFDYRLGAEGRYELGEGRRLVTTLEGVHRAQNPEQRITGELLGVSDFSFTSGADDEDWLRASVGMDMNLGPGDVQAHLNVTTHGAQPSAWVSMQYRVAF